MRSGVFDNLKSPKDPELVGLFCYNLAHGS